MSDDQNQNNNLPAMVDEATSDISNKNLKLPIKNKGKLTHRSSQFCEMFDAGLPKKEIMLTMGISQNQYRTLLEEAYDRKDAPPRPTPSYQVEGAHQLPGGIKFQFQECYKVDISTTTVKSEIWTAEKVIAQRNELPAQFQILIPLELKTLSGNDK